LAVDSSQSQVLPPEPSGDGATIAAVIADVTDKAALIVREEIELAKAEVSEKVTKLVKGAIVGAAAGVFAVIGLLFLVHGAAWLAWWALPAGDTHEGEFFWGYFLVAALLFVVGAIAGYIAYRAVRAGTPPVPELAIDEAKRIRETVQSPTPTKTV
jgi:uncharacterized membrane protein YqjE